MKKSIDTKPALYPTPVTVIGTMNGDKPTWTLAAHIGIIGHDRILDAGISESEIQGWIRDMNETRRDCYADKDCKYHQKDRRCGADSPFAVSYGFSGHG